MAGQVLTASAERHREQFDQLVAQVAAYNPDVDRDLLERAYHFASEAHEHQQRRSGELGPVGQRVGADGVALLGLPGGVADDVQAHGRVADLQ